LSVTIGEYQNAQRDELEEKGVDWGSLTEYVKGLESEIKRLGEHLEDPPYVTEDYLWPGGWVGTFKPKKGTPLTVESRLKGTDWDTMMKDVVGWIGIPTNPMVKTLFRFSPDRQLRLSSLALAYSRYLIAQTEALMTQSPPRQIVSRRHVGTEIRGTYRPLETVLHQLQNPNEYVSRRVQFQLATSAVLVFVLFHAQVTVELNGLNREGETRPSIERQLSYHYGVLSRKPFSDLIDMAFDPRLDLSEMLQKARIEVQRDVVFQGLLDLFEAFTTKRSFLLQEDPRNLDTTTKPSSKVYELWCLKILIEELKSLLGPMLGTINELPATISFPRGVNLHYEGSGGVPSFSRLTRKLRKFDAGSGYGRPDFLIEVDGKVKGILDAKYKTQVENIDIHDVQRFYSYLLDYMSPDKRLGVLLHVDDEHDHEVARVDTDSVHLIRLRPNNIESGRKELHTVLEKEILA
jgi:hypothetical protein